MIGFAALIFFCVLSACIGACWEADRRRRNWRPKLDITRVNRRWES